MSHCSELKNQDRIEVLPFGGTIGVWFPATFIGRSLSPSLFVVEMENGDLHVFTADRIRLRWDNAS